MNCIICNGQSKKLGQALIMGKYKVNYQRCDACGFVWVDEPHWLKEAYESVVTCTDLGMIHRVDFSSKITKLVIHAFNKPEGKFLDFGSGPGIFVRTMRDLGYDFRWQDKYSTNQFAKGFEAEQPIKTKYNLA